MSSSPLRLNVVSLELFRFKPYSSHWLARLSLCLFLCISNSTPLMAQDDKHVLSLAQSWNSDFPIFGETTLRFAAMVKKMSSGRLTINIDAAEKHGSPLKIFNMVKAGQYDMGHSASYYWKDIDKNTLFFTGIPFGMTTPEQHAWFYYGGGLELMQKVYSKHNMLSFPGGNTGNQMGGWFRKRIQSISDLKGLKIRMPGLAGKIYEKFGAKVVNIPPGELYNALANRDIDALEWVGPSLDLAMGFHKIAPYYYTGWHEPTSELQFLINKKTWGKLPGDLQEIMRVAMFAAAQEMYVQSYHVSAKNLATMLDDYPDLQVRPFPKPVIKALRKANDELIKELASKDPLSREIIKSMAAYLRIARDWTGISDNAYLNSLGL